MVFSAAGIFSISPNNFPLLVRLLSTWIQFSTYVRPLSACTDETVEVNFTSQMILLQVYVEDLNSHAALSTQLSTLEMFVDRTIVSHDIVIDFNFICGPFIHISILFQLQCIFFVKCRVSKNHCLPRSHSMRAIRSLFSVQGVESVAHQ